MPNQNVRRGLYTNYVSSVRNVPEKDTGLDWTRKALEERKINAVVRKEDTDVLILLRNSYVHELWYGGLLYVLYVYMINL